MLDALLLRGAFQRALSYSAEEAARVQEGAHQADLLVRAANALDEPDHARVRATLLRDALRGRIRAAGGEARAIGALRPALDEVDMQRVLRALDTRSLLDAPELRETTRALERAERAARGSVEPRSLERLVVTRWARVAALVLGVGYLLFRTGEAWLGAPNIAFHRHVSASGEGNLSAAATLVDGDKSTLYSPFVVHGHDAAVTIDLGGAYTLDRVVVFNRLDGHFDQCLPLDLSVSLDGRSWSRVEHRRDHFTVWRQPLEQRQARFVRLSTEGSELGLVEVEVYGRYGR